jgi:hypothetical protein
LTRIIEDRDEAFGEAGVHAPESSLLSRHRDRACHILAASAVIAATEILLTFRLCEDGDADLPARVIRATAARCRIFGIECKVETRAASLP